MGVVGFIETEIAPLVGGVNCFFLFDGVFVLLVLRELSRASAGGWSRPSCDRAERRTK